MKFTPGNFKLRREGENRHWPAYLFWGRMRTSTAGLIIAFFVTSWVYNTYQPPAPAPAVPAQQVVPPGFVPDPEYTWVPRTNVERTTPRTTTTTTTPTPTTTETTEPTDTTTTTTTLPGVPPTTTTPLPGAPTTTVIDPDGPGPIPPLTLPVLPGAAPPVTTATTIDPGVAPATPPAPARSAS